METDPRKDFIVNNILSLFGVNVSPGWFRFHEVSQVSFVFNCSLVVVSPGKFSSSSNLDGEIRNHAALDSFLNEPKCSVLRVCSVPNPNSNVWCLLIDSFLFVVSRVHFDFSAFLFLLPEPIWSSPLQSACCWRKIQQMYILPKTTWRFNWLRQHLWWCSDIINCWFSRAILVTDNDKPVLPLTYAVRDCAVILLPHCDRHRVRFTVVHYFLFPFALFVVIPDPPCISPFRSVFKIHCPVFKKLCGPPWWWWMKKHDPLRISKVIRGHAFPFSCLSCLRFRFLLLGSRTFWKLVEQRRRSSETKEKKGRQLRSPWVCLCLFLGLHVSLCVELCIGSLIPLSHSLSLSEHIPIYHSVLSFFSPSLCGLSLLRFSVSISFLSVSWFCLLILQDNASLSP